MFMQLETFKPKPFWGPAASSENVNEIDTLPFEATQVASAMMPTPSPKGWKDAHDPQQTVELSAQNTRVYTPSKTGTPAPRMTPKPVDQVSPAVETASTPEESKKPPHTSPEPKSNESNKKSRTGKPEVTSPTESLRDILSHEAHRTTN